MILSFKTLHELARAEPAGPADIEERVRAEIAQWFVAAERERVYRCLRRAVFAVPEHARSDAYIAIVRRSAGSYEALEAAIAAAEREGWAGFGR